MSLHSSNGVCLVGALDYRKYAQQFVPIVERARSGRSMDPVEELRALIMGVADNDQRTESLAQLERIEVAVQGGRWHRSAIGVLLEATCVEDRETVPDFLATFTSCSCYLYDWNEDFAEAIYAFFSELNDKTVPWASPTDTWRAIVPPDQLAATSEAFGALSARDLKKMLAEAEGGDVFSEDDAKEIAGWWEAVRKALRVSLRTERAFYFSIHKPEV